MPMSCPLAAFAESRSEQVVVTGCKVQTIGWVGGRWTSNRSLAGEWQFDGRRVDARCYGECLCTVCAVRALRNCVFGPKGDIVGDFLPVGTTRNADRYCETLEKTQKGISELEKRNGEQGHIYHIFLADKPVNYTVCQSYSQPNVDFVGLRLKAG